LFPRGYSRVRRETVFFVRPAPRLARRERAARARASVADVLLRLGFAREPPALPAAGALGGGGRRRLHPRSESF